MRVRYVAVVDTVRARTRWLLRSLREHATDPTLRSLRGFGAAYPGGGVDKGTVSRWETGETPIGYEQLRGYESLLDLPPRHLIAVVDSVARLEDGVIGAPPLRRPAPPDDAERQRQVLSLVDQADSPDPMTSHDWDDLSDLLSGWAHPGIRDRDWAMLTARLATEMYASEAHAWLRRQEALLRLLGHPSGGRVAVATCAALIDDPTSPLSGDVLLVLDGATDPNANATVLRQLQTATSSDARHQAVIVGLQKLRIGHFRHAAHIDALVSFTTEFVTLPELPTVRIMATELLKHFAHRLRSADRRHLDRAAGDSVTSTGRLRGVRLPARRLAGGPIFDALVDDLLCHPDPSRRFFAGQWLAVSPHGAPLGRQLAAELRRPDVLRDGVSAPVYLQALTILGSPDERPLVEDLFRALEVPPAVRYSAARTLLYLPDRSSPAFWRAAAAHHRAAWLRRPSANTAALLDQLAYAAGATHDTPLLDQRERPAELP